MCNSKREICLSQARVATDRRAPPRGTSQTALEQSVEAGPNLDTSEPDGPSPGDLVRAAMRGDPLAWAALLILLRSTAVSAAREVLRHEADAEDVAHDTMAKVVKRLGTLKNPDAVVSWTSNIAHNIAINRTRKRREVPTEPEVLEERARFSPPSAREPLLRPALAQLPLQQSAVLVARHVDDMTWDEIAREQGVSVGTVKSRARLALARLRTEFDPRK